MKKVFVVLVVAAVNTGLCFGAFSKNDAGTSAAQFLKLGAGARAAGMGEAVGAVADDSTAIYWNPAGLDQVAARAVAAMHAVWFEDITYDWLSYAQNAGKLGVIGVGVQYLSYGSIKQMDSTGLETGNFGPTDLCVSLAYAHSYKGVDLGVNVKYISLKIVDSASAKPASESCCFTSAQITSTSSA